VHQQRNQLAVRGLLVADETDLARFRIDGRTLALDNLDRLPVEGDCIGCMAFDLCDTSPVEQDRPVDFTVGFRCRLAKQFIVAGLCGGNVSGFPKAPCSS